MAYIFYHKNMSADETLEDLLDITKELLGPGGCPWDRSRDPEDVKSQLVEETYEVREAIDEDQDEEIEEELGDLLYQVVFLTELYGDDRDISLDGVIEAISEKLVRRHPHVFEDETAENPEEGVSQWEEVKRAERDESSETDESVVLSGVPDELPALLRGYRLTQKAASAGFDWNDPASALRKVKEELKELEREMEQDQEEAVFREFGDLLFACANVGRCLDVDPEEALQQGNDKFIRRFKKIEQRLGEQGRDIDDANRKELISLWDEIRQREQESGASE